MLSPLFLRDVAVDVVWTDVYDDWSRARDIRQVHRWVAAAGYRRLLRERERFGLITANTSYMADLVGGAHVVPNGVDPSLAELDKSGSDSPVLLVLGSFFDGRTNNDLLERVLMHSFFQEAHIGFPGDDFGVRRTLTAVRNARPGRVHIHDWLTAEDIATLAGPRAVALVPNVVTSYTMSQDIMKAYQFAALGIPIICPRELWPAKIPHEWGLQLEHDADIQRVLNDWDVPIISDDQRAKFVQENSWLARANTILNLISGMR